MLDRIGGGTDIARMLAPGSRLGPYEVNAPLGAGGMGEVYAATDTRLGRKVALKILPPELAQNRERRARFEREARSISRLNHPHICTLHDVGENYLVMELLEGETLAQRLGRGPLPLAEIVRFGSEIAEALERAHRAGVVHRDLKPSNVMLTKSGAKLLDFGLAKISGMVEVSPDSLTRDSSVTSEGTIVGSFPYMAPEQVEGRATDHRADIFALGAILYEMATGRRAFAGDTHAAVIGAILSTRPPAAASVRPGIPPRLDDLIARCLEKSPDERWQSAKDAAVALRWIGESDAAGATRPRRRVVFGLVVAIVALAAAAGLTGFLVKRSVRAAPEPSLQLEIAAPQGLHFLWAEGRPFAVSPDGKTLALVAGKNVAGMSLFLRDLTGGVPRRIEGSEHARSPFWSADGTRVAFFKNDRLMELSPAHEVPREICAVDARGLNGASWSPSGTILFANQNGVHRVDQSGGTPPLLVVGATGGSFYADPDFLPDGEHYLLTRIDDRGRAFLEIRRIGFAWAKNVADDAANGRWSGTGHVLFERDGALMALEFDASRLTVRGRAQVVAPRVGHVPDVALRSALFSVARHGRVLAMKPSAERETELIRFGPEGEVLQTLAGPAVIFGPALSHDATRVAIGVEDEDGSADIRIVDIARGATTRLGSGPGNERFAVWSPDDQFLAYGADDGLYRMRVDGGRPERLLKTDHRVEPTDWSLDGETILLDDFRNISAFRFSDRRLHPVVATPFGAWTGKFSPDCEWIAYTAADTGAGEIYIQRFRDGAFKTRVSSQRGTLPVWSRDGRQLYFWPNSVVDVIAGEGLTVSAPRALYWFARNERRTIGKAYGILPDRTFVTLALPVGESTDKPIDVVADWTTRLPR